MNDPINIFTAESDSRIDVGAAAGSTDTAMFVYDLAPGESSCPYHYEYVDEWLLVVSGTVTVRSPEGTRTLAQGDIVRFPAGPAGAHKIMNTGDAPARTLLFSSVHGPAVSVYPDSGKIGVWPGDAEDSLIFLRDSAVPWSHGEAGWDRAD